MTNSFLKTAGLPYLPIVLACLVSALVVGCDSTPPTGTVKGTVTLDGEIYTNVNTAVVLIGVESGQAGQANIQADGTFSIENPLPLGTYTAFLTPVLPGVDESEEHEPKEVPKDPSVPEKYWNEGSSDLKAEVVAGENDVKLEITN